MKLERLEIERFYDQRAPSDKHRGQRVPSDNTCFTLQRLRYLSTLAWMPVV